MSIRPEYVLLLLSLTSGGEEDTGHGTQAMNEAAAEESGRGGYVSITGVTAKGREGSEWVPAPANTGLRLPRSQRQKSSAESNRGDTYSLKESTLQTPGGP